MSTDEFEVAVEKGATYVILDEFVLDVGSFIKEHPGGSFVLKHNIGRDISKFFYGGYSLEGNLGPRPAAGHKHSNYARKIVNQLIIAQLEREKVVQSTICELDDVKSNIVNEKTKTLYLKSKDRQPVPNFKKFYPELSMLGKHFTVRALTENKPTRHYTICNVMEP